MLRHVNILSRLNAYAGDDQGDTRRTTVKWVGGGALGLDGGVCWRGVRLVDAGGRGVGWTGLGGFGV